MATTPRPRLLPSGRVSWRVQFRMGAKVTSESFADEREARAFARLVDTVGGEAAHRTRNARDEPAHAAPTLAEWTYTYLDPLAGHLTGVTAGTRRGYRDIAERSFLRVLGEMPIDIIRKQDVARWVAWQEAQPSLHRPGQQIASKTVKNYHGTLSAVLAGAVDARVIDHNPARGTKLTRGIRHEGVFLTVAEFQRLRDAMPEYYRPLATWLAYTGMRWGEATALTWADLDLNTDPPTARVAKAWQKGESRSPVLGPPKTEKSRRTIVVNRWVMEELGAPGPANELVFRGMKDGHRLWWQRFYKAAWAPAVAEVNKGQHPMGKRPRIHDLRHSHVSWLIADKVSPHVIQYRLGHESITTTYDRYGHLMADAHVQVMESLDGRRTTGLAEIAKHEQI